MHFYSVNKRYFDKTWMEVDVLIDQNVPSFHYGKRLEYIDIMSSSCLSVLF